MGSGNRVFYSGLVSLALLAGFEFLVVPPGNLSLLPAILFWLAVSQGAVALVSVSRLSSGGWIDSLAPHLLESVRYLWIPIPAFLILIRHLAAYPWHEHPGTWLNSHFFIGRNSVVLLCFLVVAKMYRRAALKRSPGENRHAVLLLLVFVASQSLMAIDWVMSLEYPFINTLFAGYFFIEALYAGIALAAVVMLLKFPKSWPGTRLVMGDIARLIIGFALLWAGLFFSQYLVIWYGNIPEEALFIARRMETPTQQALGTGILLFLFVLPFAGLIPRRIRQSHTAPSMFACLILLGLLVERILLVSPVTAFNIWIFLVEWLILGAPLILIYALRAKPNTRYRGEEYPSGNL